MKTSHKILRPRRLGALLRYFSHSCLVTCLAAISWAADSTGTIAGNVLDPASGNYLVHARVTVEGANLEAFTDDIGFYRLERVPVGEVRMRVFYTGLAEAQRTATVASGQLTKQDFVLGAREGRTSADAPLKMGEVVVSSSQEMSGADIAINEKRFARNMINVASAEEFGKNPDGNIAEILKFLPGVSIDYNSGEGRNISLNGVPNNYVPVTVGGFDLANAPTSGNNRNVDLNSVSMSNLSRVEVVTSNTPETPGAALAGSVNLVPRSALERATPLFTVNAFAMMRDNERSLKKTPGPDESLHHHVIPGLDFSYVVPVNSRLGFTVSGSSTDQVLPQDLVQLTWTGVSGASSANLPAPGVASPYLSSYQVGDRPRRSVRAAAATTLDYKFSANDQISLSFSWGQYNYMSYARTIRFLVNRAPADGFGRTFTHGLAGAGEVQMTNNARQGSGSTLMPSLTYRHQGPLWKVEAGAAYSYSTLNYADLSEGFLRGDLLARRTGVTVSFDDVTSFGPRRITVTDGATGAPVNPYALDSYAFAGGPLSDYRDFSDVKRSVYAKVGRDFSVGEVPLSLKAGIDIRQAAREGSGGTISSSYVGPDGRGSTTPGGGDDNAGFLVDPIFSQRTPPFGLPRLQWLSNQKAARLYKEHPSYFTTDPNAIYRSIVNFNKLGEETVWAAFFRADAQFFDRRLKVTTGVRAEQTNIDGEGPLTDPTGNYQRDASGNIVYQRDANGNVIVGSKGQPTPVLRVPTTDALGVSKLTFLNRAAHTSKEYLRLFPSLNLGYNVRENLIVRAAYYESVGRPPFSQYYNGITLPDTDQLPSSSNRISVNNPGIKAWQARTMRFAAEYYVGQAGIVSLSAFRRDFQNFFGSVVTPVTAETLQQLELDPALYGGYNIATNFNIPGSVRMQGIDFSYKQALTFLPTWARGVQVFGNLSSQRVLGDASANFQGFVPRTYSWGISLTRPRYSLSANWNYRGRQRMSEVTGAGIESGVYNWAARRVYLDLNGEVNLTRHLSLYVSLRNFNDATEDMEVRGPNTPDYATFRQREDFAALWTLGLKGKF